MLKKPSASGSAVATVVTVAKKVKTKDAKKIGEQEFTKKDLTSEELFLMNI